MSKPRRTPDRRSASAPSRFAAPSPALGLALLLLASTMGCAEDAAIRLPSRVPAAVSRTRDDNIVFQSSALVELHIWLVALATHPSVHTPKTLERSREIYERVLRESPTDALARSTTEALGECDDLPCAKRVLAPAGLDEAYSSVYSWFFGQIWPLAFAHTDRALQRLRAALPETMPALVNTLAMTLGAPPPSTIRLDIVHESPRFRDAPYLPLALEDSEPCLRGRREDESNAIACSLFQVALKLREKSAIYARLDAGRGRTDEERERTNLLYSLVAAYAVRIVSRAANPSVKESFSASLLTGSPEAEAFFARRWNERTTVEFATDLGSALSR